MNTEAEKHVCSLLLQSASNDNLSVPNYPRLNLDTVKLLSRSITNIIYDSFKNESITTKNNRDTIIGLLSKWSKNNISNHLNINNQNRQVVIKCLYNRTNDKVKDQLLDKFYRESLSENFENNLWMNILTTLENASKIHVGNTTSRDIIQTLDSIQLQDRGFICTIPNKIIQKNDFQRALDSLKVIAHDESKDKSVSITKTTMKNTNYLPALGYALLNLEKNEENNKLFAEVVNDLVKKSYYLKDEYDFLNYVWINEKKLNVSPHLYKKITNSCQFLFEKPIIRIACETLNTEDPNYHKIFTESAISNILPSLNENKLLFYNIQNCIFELYNLSNYDIRMKNLLLALKEIVLMY